MSESLFLVQSCMIIEIYHSPALSPFILLLPTWSNSPVCQLKLRFVDTILALENLSFPAIFDKPEIVSATEKDAGIPANGALFNLLKAASENKKLGKTKYMLRIGM